MPSQAEGMVIPSLESIPLPDTKQLTSFFVVGSVAIALMGLA